METGVLRGARVNGAMCAFGATVSLRGVKVVGARGCGVVSSDAGSHISMHGCSVVGSGDAGVKVQKGATATLTEVDVRGGEWGICTIEGRVDVQGGVVSGCAKAGVHAQGGGQVSANAVSVHHCLCGLGTADSASKITATRVNVHAIGENEYVGNVVVVPDASSPSRPIREAVSPTMVSPAATPVPVAPRPISLAWGLMKLVGTASTAVYRFILRNAPSTPVTNPQSSGPH